MIWLLTDSFYFDIIANTNEIILFLRQDWMQNLHS